MLVEVEVVLADTAVTLLLAESAVVGRRKAAASLTDRFLCLGVVEVGGAGNVISLRLRCNRDWDLECTRGK